MRYAPRRGMMGEVGSRQAGDIRARLDFFLTPKVGIGRRVADNAPRKLRRIRRDRRSGRE